jgi:hypothetical protein
VGLAFLPRTPIVLACPCNGMQAVVKVWNTHNAVLIAHPTGLKLQVSCLQVALFLFHWNGMWPHIPFKVVLSMLKGHLLHWLGPRDNGLLSDAMWLWPMQW